MSKNIGSAEIIGGSSNLFFEPNDETSLRQAIESACHLYFNESNRIALFTDALKYDPSMNFIDRTKNKNSPAQEVPFFIDFFYLSFIFLAPATILLVRGSTSAILILLALISIAYGIISSKAMNYISSISHFRYYALASICFPLAIIIQQVYLDQWDPRALDAISRFTVGFILFLFLSYLFFAHLVFCIACRHILKFHQFLSGGKAQSVGTL